MQKIPTVRECRMCAARGKTWEGSDPTCAFPDGTFTTDNWSCATMHALRLIATNGWSWDVQPFTMYVRDDMAGGSFAALHLSEIPHGEPDADGYRDEASGYLVMTWYKSRGRTGQAWIMHDEDEPRRLTEVEAFAIIEANADDLRRHSPELHRAYLRARATEVPA